MAVKLEAPGKVQSPGSDVDGARVADLGGHRGPARAAGWSGITGVARATGISSSTIQRGLQELTAKGPLAPGRIRRPGGGRKKTLAKIQPCWPISGAGGADGLGRSDVAA